MQDYLFWSPQKLGCQVNTTDKSIRIEDLCWVLDKERLCKSITGIEWDEVSMESSFAKC